MTKLNNLELKKVRGGISGWAIAGIISGCIFLIGVFDGISRPIKCN